MYYNVYNAPNIRLDDSPRTSVYIPTRGCLYYRHLYDEILRTAVKPTMTNPKSMTREQFEKSILTRDSIYWRPKVRRKILLCNDNRHYNHAIVRMCRL